MAGFAFVVYTLSMARRVIPLLVMGMFTLVASCGDRTSERQLSPSIAGMPTVADAPSLTIGVVDGDPEYQFVDVVGATRRRDSRVDRAG